MFTLVISCLTIFNLPWFMDLTFQVPMQYCSLQHRTLLLSPVTSTTGCCFCFAPSLHSFWSLFLHWSPVACWAPTDLWSSSFSVLSFCLFLLFMGFSRQEYWSGNYTNLLNVKTNILSWAKYHLVIIWQRDVPPIFPIKALLSWGWPWRSWQWYAVCWLYSLQVVNLFFPEGDPNRETR